MARCWQSNEWFGAGKRTGWLRIPLSVVTFLLVCVGWVFFRAKTLAAALFVLGQMISTVARTFAARARGSGVWRFCRLLIALAEEYRGMLTRLTVSPAWARTVAVVVALLAIELFSATEQTIPFVYFQF